MQKLLCCLLVVCNLFYVFVVTMMAGYKEEDEELSQSSGKRRFDPSQDPEERRRIRRKMRAIKQKADEKGVELSEPGNEECVKLLKEEDKTFENVKNTRDALMDLSTVKALTRIAQNQARSLTQHFINLTPAGLLEHLKLKLNVAKDEIVPANCNAWEKVADHAVEGARLVSVTQFMNGPLAMDVAKKARKVAEKMGKVTEEGAVKPNEGVDPELDKQGETDTIAQEINQILEDQELDAFDDMGYMPLLQLVTNPKSYGQTVENLFYLSTLVSVGKAALFSENGDDDELLVASGEAEDEDEENENKNKNNERPGNSCVFEMSMADWKDAIKVYKITSKNQILKHRDYSKLTQ
eukprot:m.338053 g.338053  ORF g.338053 m.338053 type:complete len:352 (+) comp18303_c0_seq1:32-1087(+)